MEKLRVSTRLIAGYTLLGVAFGSLLTLGVLHAAGVPLVVGLNTSSFQKFLTSYEDLSQKYFKSVPQQTLLNGAVAGMVQSLNDPFTDYFTPSAATQFHNMLSGSFDGIGVTVEQHGGNIVVHSVITGSPAAHAGIHAGDLILAVNGHTTVGVTLERLTGYIVGPAGTSVHLQMARPSDAMRQLSLTVVRAKISQPTVNFNMLQNHIGYLQITVVGDQTDTEVANALRVLKKQGATRFIVDVRGNPGGLLDVVVRIAGDFIPKGERVLATVDRDAQPVPINSPGPGLHMPVVVLMDQDTASAAEVLAAALHNDVSAPLVGTKSFGKGTVQVTEMFTDGSGLKYTVAKWLTPTGAWIHGKGLQPTVAVSLPAFATLPNLQDASLPLLYNRYSPDVITLQKSLQAIGFVVDRTDGFYDVSTRNAVLAFQKQKGIVATGNVDAVTAAEIQNSVSQLLTNADTQLQKAIQVVLRENNS